MNRTTQPPHRAAIILPQARIVEQSPTTPGQGGLCTKRMLSSGSKKRNSSGHVSNSRNASRVRLSSEHQVQPYSNQSQPAEPLRIATKDLGEKGVPQGELKESCQRLSMIAKKRRDQVLRKGQQQQNAATQPRAQSRKG